MNDPTFDNSTKGLCIVCSLPVTVGSRLTCSEKCHDKFVKFSEEKFGITKKIVDVTTGIAYRVPTRDLIEKGLAWKDLTKYPVWKD
jgi:hypothetical protein